jgi:hypothetical protein
VGEPDPDVGDDEVDAVAERLRGREVVPERDEPERDRNEDEARARREPLPRDTDDDRADDHRGEGDDDDPGTEVVRSGGQKRAHERAETAAEVQGGGHQAGEAGRKDVAHRHRGRRASGDAPA